MTNGQIFLGMVALTVATVVYRWQRSVDHQHKLQDEKRDAISKLILAIEHYMSTVKEAFPVSVQEMPETSAHRIELQKALSVVRVRGCRDLVDSTIDYERSIRACERKLAAEKRLRLACKVTNTETGRVQRTPEYREAQEERLAVFKDLVEAREALFKKFSRELGVEVSAKQLDSNDDKQDDAA